MENKRKCPFASVRRLGKAPIFFISSGSKVPFDLYVQMGKARMAVYLADCLERLHDDEAIAESELFGTGLDGASGPGSLAAAARGAGNRRRAARRQPCG